MTFKSCLATPPRPPPPTCPPTSHAGLCSLFGCARGPLQSYRQAAPSAKATLLPMMPAATSCQGILLLRKLLHSSSVLGTARCTYTPEAGAHVYLADDTGQPHR